jgi:photosystem II stability/assembly factor-like uncharacterized protein
MNFLLLLGLISALPVRHWVTAHGATVQAVPVTFGEPGRPADPIPDAPVDSGFTWHLQGSFGSVVFTDLSFADDSVGYASAEAGIVYRTTNSGQNWTRVMNLGFPYYWYGVHALTRDTVIVTGFTDPPQAGIYCWSFNGGTSWGNVVPLDTPNWFSRVQFADPQHGIIVVGWNGAIWRTDSGGLNPSDWSYVQLDTARGWYAGNFTFLPDLNSYLTGITFCHSRDAGVNWDVAHSIDPVFDGAVSFPDTMHGWTGGGQISEPVKGWIHRTTDAGDSWSDRLIETPWPIRSLLFLNDTLGFAVGGNHFSAVGGIYSTTNAGDSWRLDVNTQAEMQGIDAKPAGNDSTDVWCAGYNSSLTGVIYKTRIGFPVTGVSNPPAAYRLSPTALRVWPNPAHGRVNLELDALPGQASRVSLFDASGRRVRAWRSGRTVLDLSGLAPGCYVVEIRSGTTCRRAQVTVLPDE